jgi:transposase
MQQQRFTKEFSEEAVRLVQTSGRTQREIAGDLGIGCRRWFAGSAGAGIDALSTRRRWRAMSRRS